MKKGKFNYKKAYKKLSKRINLLEDFNHEFLTQNSSFDELEKKAEKEYFSGFDLGNEKDKSAISIIIDDPKANISSEKTNKMFENVLNGRKKKGMNLKNSKEENKIISEIIGSTIKAVKTNNYLGECIGGFHKESDKKITVLKNVVKQKDIQIEAQKRKIKNLNIAVHKKNRYDVNNIFNVEAFINSQEIEGKAKEKLQESINKSASNHIEIKDMVKGEVYVAMRDGVLTDILKFNENKYGDSIFVKSRIDFQYDEFLLADELVFDSKTYNFRKANKLEKLHLQTAVKFNMFLSIELFKKLIDSGLTNY